MVKNPITFQYSLLTVTFNLSNRYWLPITDYFSAASCQITRDVCARSITVAVRKWHRMRPSINIVLTVYYAPSLIALLWIADVSECRPTSMTDFFSVVRYFGKMSSTTDGCFAFKCFAKPDVVPPWYGNDALHISHWAFPPDCSEKWSQILLCFLESSDISWRNSCL